jgi:hypothetical protein
MGPMEMSASNANSIEKHESSPWKVRPVERRAAVDAVTQISKFQGFGIRPHSHEKSCGKCTFSILLEQEDWKSVLLLLVETIKLYYEAIKYIEKYTLDKQYFITL